MKDENRVKYLISAMLDESISEDESRELDEILQESQEAREIYRRYIDMHFSLNEISEDKEVVKFTEELPSPEELPEKFNSMRHRLIFFQVLAACLAIASIVSFLNTREVIKEVEVVKTVKEKIPLATISKVSEDIKWESREKKIGETVTDEEIILDRGQLTLTYNHGAEIKIEGPAHYTLKSLELAVMKYGHLAAKVPEAAQGFTIESPKAAIVDLGTEFALNVSKEGKSRVFVYEGEVVSSLLNENGTTLVNANLYGNEGIEIDSTLETVSDLSGSEDFIRIDEKSDSDLTITNKYIEAVKAHKPYAYWRFENSEDGVVKNEMSEDFHGKLTHEARTSGNQFVVEKGHIGGFLVEQPIYGFNKKNYTIELWLKAKERGSDMSLISIMAPEVKNTKDGYDHLVYTQLMSNNKRLRCKPFDFRFSHRHPATHNVGKNAFAGEEYIPGKWYHMVCVRNDTSFSLFLNGELKSTIPVELNNDDLGYLFYMGKIDPLRNMRQFIGQIDEVALYKRALSQDEILEHYNAVEVK